MVLLEELSGLNIFDALILIKDKIIDGINAIIFGVSAENPVAVIFLISVLIGVGIKRWKKLKWGEGIFIMFLIFMSLRFLGIGG